MKECTKCLEKKPFDEFYPNKTLASGLDSRCKECRRIARREAWATDRGGHRTKDFDRRAARTPEQVAAHHYGQFVYKLRREFKMTVEQYDAMFEAQGGVCAMHGGPETKIHHLSGQIQRLAVDHDHSCCPTTPTCGKCVRGLLCAFCNQMLGMIEKIPGLEHNLIAYLSSTSV